MTCKLQLANGVINEYVRMYSFIESIKMYRLVTPLTETIEIWPSSLDYESDYDGGKKIRKLDKKLLQILIYDGDRMNDFWPTQVTLEVIDFAMRITCGN